MRREGLRVSAGPWTACGHGVPRGGRLIVALGRVAGNATVRSRIRRIARDTFVRTFGRRGGVDLLLLARSNVSALPRREVRARLEGVMVRLSAMLPLGQIHRKADA